MTKRVRCGEVVKPKSHSCEAIEEVPPLTDIQLAQLAQNIADEGSFRYSRSRFPVHDKYRRPYWAYYPELRVGMTDEKIIKYFAKLLGAKIEVESRDELLYTYYLSSKKLLTILPQTRAYLKGEKAKQADIILKYRTFYIPYIEPSPPRYLSLVRKEVTEYAQRSVKITPYAPPLTREKIDIILRLAELGLSSRRIAREVGRSHTTVLRVIRRYRKT